MTAPTVAEITGAPQSPAACNNSAEQPPETPTTASDGTFSIPVAARPKLSGWDFYRQCLGSPRLIVAPMVDQSELAWRMLCRQHGAQLCYSPMFHSSIFTQDPKYRQQALQSCPADRPLIIQFCGNDPDVLLAAGLLAQDHCDAIDINLGCPQAIAKRGHYGAFLQDEWPLVERIVRTLHERLAVPVTCKIRVFADVDKTVRYARMLEAAGCQLLTVHGRTSEQKGALTGLADWSAIRAVRQAIGVPMFANGNIQCAQDIDRCIAQTGVQGVMTAEGNLHNPALFDARAPVPGWTVAGEYLDWADRYPCPTSYVRGHLFKIFHHLLNLPENESERQAIAVGQSNGAFRDAVERLAAKYAPVHEGCVPFAGRTTAPDSCDLALPPWLCQSYVRLEPDEHRRLLAEKELRAADPERVREVYRDEEGNEISRKSLKKLRRKQRQPNYDAVTAARRRRDRMVAPLCSQLNPKRCGNPKGLSCDREMCRACCRVKCGAERLKCVGHQFGLMARRRNGTVDEGRELAADETEVVQT